MSVTLNLTNNGKTVSLNLHNGRKGEAFKYEDFTPEQLEALKLKFEDLSPEEVLALKGDKGDALTFEDLTPEQVESLRGEQGYPIKIYDSLAEAQALDPKPADGVIFQVSELDSANAGEYSFQSTEVGGVRFEKETINKQISDAKNDLGIEKYVVGSNLLQDIIGKSLSDTDYWTPGYFNFAGIVTSSSSYYHTAKYYRVVPGDYHFKAHFNFGARSVLYDENFEIAQIIENPATSGFPYVNDITIPENAHYIRMSFVGSDTSGITLSPYQDIEIKKFKFDTLSRIGTKNTSVPINGFSVANTLKDIYKKSNPAKLKTPIVTFISDDGSPINNDWFIPILNSKDVKASFAVITNRFGESFHFTKSEVKALGGEGHDFIAHTHGHENLTDITLTEAEESLLKCKTELLALGVDANMFVSPFGSRNTDVDKLIRKYYKTNFISRADNSFSGLYSNTSPINSLSLKRVHFDAVNESANRIDFLKSAVDQANSSGGWLVFAVHPQYDEYSPTANPVGYEARRNELYLLIDYIQSLNIPILTASQAFSFYKNPVEIGNVNLDEKYYALGMDGTETGNYFD